MPRACSRPSAERLRWVAQSSSRNPCGSPVPGARAWRNRATAPPSRRACHAASEAGAGTAPTKVSRIVQARIMRMGCLPVAELFRPLRWGRARVGKEHHGVQAQSLRYVLKQTAILKGGTAFFSPLDAHQPCHPPLSSLRRRGSTNTTCPDETTALVVLPLVPSAVMDPGLR